MAEPLTDPIGTVYRVFYADGTALYTESHYQEAQAQYPDEMTAVQRFSDAQWQYDGRADVWLMTAVTSRGTRIELAEATDPEADTLPESPVITRWLAQQEALGDADVFYDPETGTGSIQAEYGDRTDLGDAAAAAPTERNRVQELADRVRAWFHRDQDRGMGL